MAQLEHAVEGVGLAFCRLRRSRRFCLQQILSTTKHQTARTYHPTSRAIHSRNRSSTICFVIHSRPQNPRQRNALVKIWVKETRPILPSNRSMLSRRFWACQRPFSRWMRLCKRIITCLTGTRFVNWWAIAWASWSIRWVRRLLNFHCRVITRRGRRMHLLLIVKWWNVISWNWRMIYCWRM